MGEYRVRQLDAEPVIYFGLPVMDDRERMAAVVFAAISLNQMNRSIFRLLEDLPAGASLTQIDASEKTLSYAPKTGTWSESGPISPIVFNLAAYLQSVRAQERTRIAREIHDDFGQALTILKMDLSWLEKRLGPVPAEDGAKMEAMIQTIDGTLITLHTVSAALRPVILDDFGLAAAIKWQAEEFQERTGIACRVDAAQWQPDPDRELATALFRIFQETLTNIIRHAGAGRVDVRLASDDGGWLLEVGDDGRGITLAEIENPRSFGLIGMRERLWPWNGTGASQRRSTGGTRVSVQVPRPSKGESS
jgi:signal transduction histidine kinase